LRRIFLYHEVLVGISEGFFSFLFRENLIVCHRLLCVVSVFWSLLFMKLMARRHNTKEEEEGQEKEKERGNNKRPKFSSKTHCNSHHCL